MTPKRCANKQICYFYNVSMETVLKNPCKCRRVMHQIAFMGGEDQAKETFKSLDMVQPKKNCSASWDHPCDSVAAIEDFQSKINES